MNRVFPEVDAVLDQLQAGIHTALGRQLVGLYLTGSLAIGGFNPGRSDIDFVAVTAGEISTAELAALKEMHRRLGELPNRWALRLEGSYLSAAALRRYDRAHRDHPHLSNGSPDLAVERHDTDWVVQLWVTRQHGRRLYGPPADMLIDPIPAAELIAAVRELFFYWWAPMAVDPSHLLPVPYRVYAVLTMPRLIYTFTTGTVASKPEAAAWSQENLEPRWAGLVQEAIAWEEGKPFDRLEDVRAFIRFTQTFAEIP